MPGRSGERFDVVVLGGGPAGLGAAYRLAARGISVCVLEREPRVGGLARSFEVDGVRVDHGSHRLHPATPPEILDELRTMLGADLQLRVRNGRIRMAGRFVAFPPRPLDLVRHLPPALAFRFARDALAGRVRRARTEPASFAEAVQGSLGPTMGERFYFPYARKLFGRDASELDAELARRRIGARRPGAILGRALRPASAQRFWYPRRGFGQIPDALGAAATSAGALVRTGCAVGRVVLSDDRVEVETEGGARVVAGQCWSTLPLPLLARLAAAPDAVLAQAARLEQRALVLVYLVVDAARYTEFDAHYFPELDVPMTRLSEPKNYRTSADDPPDRTVVCAEIPCARGDSVWTAPPGALAELVVASAARSALPELRPRGVEVRRVPAAYPVYHLGYRPALARLEAWAGAQARLVSFGRHGLFAHDNSHHALVTAWAASDAVGADGGFDRVRWDRARAAFSAHVVED